MKRIKIQKRIKSDLSNCSSEYTIYLIYLKKDYQISKKIETYIYTIYTICSYIFFIIYILYTFSEEMLIIIFP